MYFLTIVFFFILKYEAFTYYPLVKYEKYLVVNHVETDQFTDRYGK